MHRKVVFIILGVTAVLVTLILVVFLTLKKETVVSSEVKVVPTSIPLEETTTWNDQAQFSFQYPKSLSLNPHNEDQVNYAHVELSSATHSGNLIVWVKDSAADTIDNWVKTEKIKNAIDSSLADVPGKKVLTTGDINKLTISVIQNGYLYQIETNLEDADFWNKTLDIVTSSFKFTSLGSSTVKQQTPDTSTDQSPGTNGVSTEEEVVE